MKYKARVVIGCTGLVLLLCAGAARADWSLTVAADKSSPQVLAAVGSVTFTAAATGTGFSDVEYQFWLYSSASARYTLMREYGTDPNWAWTPAAVDYYVVMARARSAGSAASFDKSVALAYHVVSEVPVSAVSLSADKPSPQQVGTPVTFTAAAAGGGGSGVEYQFWLSSATNRPYRLVKNYNVSDGTWTPGAGDMDAADSYMVRVYARSKGNATSYEKTASRSFSKVSQAPVTSVALSVDKPSPQLVGTPLTFTATAAGGGAGGVEYQFWLSPSAGSAYRLVRSYDDSDGTWAPAAGDMDAADCYSVLVYARSRGGAALFEKTMARSFCLVAQTPVTAVALSVDNPSPQAAGTQLTFTATAEGGGSGVEYRFWLASGAYGNYEPVGDATTGYSPSSLWHWQPPAADSYRVMVYARSAGSVAPYEQYTMVDYTVVAGDTTCEGCHSGSYPLAPDVMGDGVLPGGDPAHTTPKPYDDGTFGYNVNGHGRDADTNAISHGNRIDVACSSCHDISAPPGRHLDGVLDGRTPTAANANPFHLRSNYIANPGANEWDAEATFDNYCWIACHQGKTTNMRHLAVSDPLPNYPELGTHQSYAQPANTPPPEMFYDVNITWLGAFNGPPNFVLCVSCHNPHGTNVVSPNLNGNNRMAIYRWERPATLCSRCHL